MLRDLLAMYSCTHDKDSVSYGVYSNVNTLVEMTNCAETLGKSYSEEGMMLIRELARLVGLPIDTIRFYEKQGLLDEAHFSRSSNNYRVYTEAAIDRLRLIRQGQAAGFTLREMKSLIHAWESEQLTFEQKQVLFQRKIEEIEQRVADLLYCKSYLETKLAAAREARPLDKEKILAL